VSEMTRMSHRPRSEPMPFDKVDGENLATKALRIDYNSGLFNDTV